MIADVPSAALIGVGLGLSAGLSPGPLLALIVSQTLAHSGREGAKVALAPLVTDLPLLFVAAVLVRGLSGHGGVMAAVSLAGGLFLLWQGWKSLTWKGAAQVQAADLPRSLRKGVLTNMLNPYTYVFWATVGGPLVVQAAKAGVAEPIAFVAAFFLCLIGSNVAVAVLAGKSRHLLGGRGHCLVMRLLGLALLAYSVLFFRAAWRFFAQG